ncbi:hypothetical protein FRB95_010697 [Tulasnella sp. JGI-2019a]|nr:hypothetical protein FRB95_010697 [Tulasnella sp. JGI-2019a]
MPLGLQGLAPLQLFLTLLASPLSLSSVVLPRRFAKILAPTIPSRNLKPPIYPTPALLKQIKFLKENPNADYIIFGQLDTPDVPLQLAFLDPLDAAAFLAFRHRLFMHGGYDIDALTYLVVVLEPTLRRKKIAPGATLKQLSDEYGEEYVDYAKSPIHNGRYHRRDGKIFTPGDMPVEREEITPIFTQVKASGRMDGLFALSKQAFESPEGLPPSPSEPISMLRPQGIHTLERPLLRIISISVMALGNINIRIVGTALIISRVRC